jgi:DNA-binding PadR family transcriptional regulator
MEMKLTNAELAILSLIAEQPRHGYEIEGVIEARGMRDWTEIGFSSIYYLLNKLEKDGLVASQLTASRGRGPAREQLITALSSYAAQLEDGLDQMHGRAEQQQPLPPFVEAMFDYSRVLAEAELNWVLGFIQEVEAGRV